MANWTYLDAYVSSLPEAQRQNLLNLIYGNVLAGSIQTTQQYEASLGQELEQLSAGLPTPIFKLRTEPYRGVTHSTNFNAMESQAIAALGILYQEAELLETAISNYGNVIGGNLDSIDATVTSLEKQVDTLELLATNSEGFVASVYDSFSEQNSYRLNRVDTIATSPFIIPDIGFVPDTFDAQVSNNMLELPISNNTTFRITNAYLLNQNPVPSGNSVASSFDIPSILNPYDVSNLLNSNPNLYWAETVDIPTLSTNKVETGLVVQLAGVQQVNNIYISPFTRFPYNITSIQYTKNVDSGSYFEMLDDPSLYPLTVGNQTNIQFSDKYADSIKIHIVQQNYSSLRYIEQGVNNTITSIFDLSANQQVPTSALEDPNSYYFAMTNIMQNLLNIGVTKASDTNTIDVYEFLYGIKSITLSKIEYLNQGIYVTKPYTISKAGAIGLDIINRIPNLCSVEYDTLVEYDDVIVPSGTPQFTSNFVQSILPADVDTIEEEILDLTDNAAAANATGITRFGVDDTSTIKVYQSNVLLSPSSYTVTQDVTTKKVTITISDGTISPSQRHICFYTINYNPTIDSYTVPLDRHDQTVVNLRIFLRSLSPNSMLTPSVSSYSMKFKQYT